MVSYLTSKDFVSRIQKGTHERVPLSCYKSNTNEDTDRKHFIPVLSTTVNNSEYQMVERL